MRNKALINLLQPGYSPFFFDQDFMADSTSQYMREFHETEEAYFTNLDVPGVNANDIQIDVEDSYIRVTAERKDVFAKNSTVTKKYDHVISIPKNVDKDKISAHYENGVLNLALHKVDQEKNKRKISVTTGEKSKSWTDFLGLKKDDFGKVEGAQKSLN